MTKLFGESIAHITSAAFMRGAASAFDMSGEDAESKRLREYFSQDPKVLDANALLNDREVVAQDMITVVVVPKSNKSNKKKR